MNTIQLNRPARLDPVVAIHSRSQTQSKTQNLPPSLPQDQAVSLPNQSALSHSLPNHSLPNHSLPNKQVCCCYVNHTAQFQIIRIAAMTGDFIERTVLPHAKVLFEASVHDQLEVHTGNLITSILSDTIPCHRLVQQKESVL